LTAALLPLAILVACGEDAPSPELVAIKTETATSNVCMEALISGVLVPHAEWGLALQTPGTGELSRPLFPFGYRAAIDGEGNPLVALCDDTIVVVDAGA
jgi:hypothetical protein